MDNKDTPHLPDPQELWKMHSDLIEFDMAVIMKFAGTVVMTKEKFMKMWEELSQTILTDLTKRT